MAAAAYDYENDPRWAECWSNILIPPHMASRPYVIDRFKRKFYQRYIDPDLVVEAMSTSSSTHPTRPSAQPSSSTANDQTRQRISGSNTRATGTSTAPASTPTSLCLDWQTIKFSFNAWVFVMAVLSVFPLVPQNLSNRAYRLSLVGTACFSLYSLFSFYRKPRAWTMQAVWQRNIIQTFIYWQLLKLMYHAPMTAGYHRSVWAKIVRTVGPLVRSYAPFMNTPISAIQKWWLR